MIEVVNEIEIRKAGEYHAKVVIDGQECFFHVNSQTFADDDLDGNDDLVEIVEEIMVELRLQEKIVFYEWDRTGHRRYADLQYHCHEVWQELLGDDFVRAFFFMWRFV